MNPQIQNTIALRDIHLPDAVSWWPPAIGWWLLGIIILLVIYFTPKLYRYLTFKPLNTVVNSSYQKIIGEYQQHSDAIRLVQDISKLLRQISMTYSGRESSAHVTGDEWVDSLNALTDKNYFDGAVKELLTSGPYKKTIDCDPQILLATTDSWIKALPKRRRI